MSDERAATASHSHLFPGARIDLASGIELGPLHLRLSDGVEVVAELVELGDGGLALSVPQFVTSAGTTVEPRVWLARAADDADRTCLVLGSRTELH